MADMFDKEELSIVSGLFPNTLAVANAEKQQQQNLAYQRFSNAAGAQNPFGGLAGLQGMFGTAAGQDIQGVMGVQSPATKLAALREQAAQQFDPNTPNGLVQMAQFLNQNGDSAGARQAVMLAQGQAQKSATFGKTMEETRILGRKEIEIGVDPKNPEMVQKALVDKDGNVLKMLGTPYSKFTQKSTNITNIPPGESEFVKQLGKNDAQTVTKAMETRDTAISTLQSLAKLESLNNQQLISGTFATGRVGAANFLNTIGLASSADVSRISSSQQYDKVAKDVIFQTLGGKLGAGFSNEDRKFIEALIPQLETSADARRQLIAYMRSKQQLIADESTRLENYARSNRGLGGFEYKIPRETLAPSGSANKPEFTREQLQAELDRKLKAQ
jgi:hypothetical protein